MDSSARMSGFTCSSCMKAEQIAGRLRLDGADHTVSAETIYRYIWRPKVHAKRL